MPNTLHLRAVLWTLAAAVLLASCSGRGGSAPPPAPAASPTASAVADEARREHVEVTLWVSPDRTDGVVRVVIDDPVPTNSSSISLHGDVLRTATSTTAVVDGEPRAIEGRGLIPWTFGEDRRLEVEVRFPLAPATNWDLAGDMLRDWVPIRVSVPRYFSRVTWDVVVHAPVAASFGGDPAACDRPAPAGLEAAACSAATELGLPPLLYLPAPDEPVRSSAGGHVQLVGALPAATADHLLAFADGAVERLNAILGDVAPRQVAVVVGDVTGNFAGEALGPMVVLDEAYVRARPDATRDLLAHELVHTAQEHRLAAPGRDPGSGLTESLAEYLARRLVHGEDLERLRALTRDRSVGDADVAEVEGLAPRQAFGRRPPVGQDHLLSTYEFQRRALVYTYLPRAWVDLQELLGVDGIDAFLRALHTRPDLDWNIDQVFALAGEFDPAAERLLRRYWEEPVPSDQEDW